MRNRTEIGFGGERKNVTRTDRSCRRVPFMDRLAETNMEQHASARGESEEKRSLKTVQRRSTSVNSVRWGLNSGSNM